LYLLFLKKSFVWGKNPESIKANPVKF